MTSDSSQSHNLFTKQADSVNTPKWTQVITKRKMSNETNVDGEADRSILKIKKCVNESRQLNTPPVVTTNRFEPLPVDDAHSEVSMDGSDKHLSSKSKSSRPPPIFLNSNVQYTPMCNVLKTIIGDNFKCVSTKKGVTLYVATPEAYRACINYLKEQDADFHSYQLSEDKPFRVVLRGLHHSVDLQVLTDELKLKGHTPKSITNVLSRTKEKLPLFFIDLEVAENNDSVFDIDTIMYSKIKIENPRPKRQLAQCTRCQQYGHTKGYCNHPPKCVRCAGPHDSSSCSKPRDTPATCALCGQSHPANYRGCTVYKDLQNRRASTSTSIKHKQDQHKPALNLNDTTVFPKLSFPMSEKTTRSQPPRQPNRNEQNPTQPLNTHQSRTYSQVTTTNDISQQFTYFFTEMKNLFTPLLTMINQLLQVLFQQHGK